MVPMRYQHPMYGEGMESSSLHPVYGEGEEGSAWQGASPGT